MADKCTISGVLVGGDTNAPCVGEIIATIHDPPQDLFDEGATNELVTTERIKAASSATTGAFTIDVIQNQLYRIIIPTVNVNAIYVIPKAATADFKDLVLFDGTNTPTP